jgi:hypothetical protein
VSATHYHALICTTCGGNDSMNGMAAAAHRRSARHIDALKAKAEDPSWGQPYREHLLSQAAAAEREAKRIKEKRARTSGNQTP